jgi:hypothetical protein
MAESVIATWLVFFLVTIAAGRIGLLAPRLSLPLISGYLVVGAVAGPFVLDIIQKEDVPRLNYVTQGALAFIAFSAGSELYLPELRALFRRIVYMTTYVNGVEGGEAQRAKPHPVTANLRLPTPRPPLSAAASPLSPLRCALPSFTRWLRPGWYPS